MYYKYLQIYCRKLLLFITIQQQQNWVGIPVVGYPLIILSFINIFSLQKSNPGLPNPACFNTLTVF